MCHFTLISLAQLPLSLAQLQSQMPINMDQLISLDQLISMDASGPGNGEYKEANVEESAGEFYQEYSCKTPPKLDSQTLKLPILTVKHPCLFHSVDMYVCVALSIIVCVWYVIVSLPGRAL